ncbi:MAG: DUF4091 domain-containing protein [Victivallales bacterium]|nr:DUF4091 domain-containing protein [Victivallales bacterium]
MMKKTLALSLLALAVFAYGEAGITRTDAYALIKGKNFICNLQAAKNYNFNFKDATSNMSIFSTIVWYHGRNANEAEHFYLDQSESNWPVFDIQEKEGHAGKQLVLQSKNNEFSLTRTIGLLEDGEALHLKYELFALETRMYASVNFPIMRVVKEVDSVSYNLEGSEDAYATEAKPSADKLARAHLVFLHSSSLNRTILVIPNLNAPLSNGELAGLATTFSNANWCKNLSFTHLYHPLVNFKRAGDKQVFECAMAVFEGNALTDDMKAKARKIAKHLGFKSPKFKMHGINENQLLPSEMAGILHRGAGVVLWQELSSKRVHPETALPSNSLPCVKVNLAKNEAESVQLALNCDDNTVIDGISISPLSNGANETFAPSNIEIQFLEYQEMHNKYTAQGMSCMSGDKLIPLEFPCPVKERNQVLWLTITCPKTQKPGTYNGTLSLKWHNSQNSQADIPIQVNIWDFTLPDKPNYTAYGLLWETPKDIRKATMELASRYRHTTTVFFGGRADFKKNYQDGSFSNTDEFELAKYAIEKLNFKTTPIPYFFMGAWNWTPDKKVYFCDLMIDSPDFEPKVKEYLTACVKQFKELGIDKNLNAYMWDEVTKPMYEAVAKTTRICKEVSPDIRVLTVGAPDEGVLKYSDITVAGDPCNWWGTIAKKRIEEARQEGKEVWVYQNGSISPILPFISTRILAWRCWGIGLTGFLYWTMDYQWKGNFSANGLNWKFYPPEKEGQPIASVRLAVMRDGIDDYDYLAMAKEKLSPEQWRQVEAMIAPLASPDDEPNIEPVSLVKTRNALGELLSRTPANGYQD